MKKPKKGYFLIVIIAIGLIIFFHSLGILNPVERILLKAVGPLQATFYNLGIGFTSFRNYRALVEENQRLKNEVSRLAVDYINLTSLEAENEYLKNELNFFQSNQYGYELARVVGSQPFNEQILIIDKGSAVGLTEGLPATVNQGVIVGKIIAVESDRSYVELLTDIDSELAVSLSHLTGTNGMLIGRVGNSLLMDLIPQDKEVREEDIVITSGLEEKIPRGLYVGRVNQVESLVGQVFKRARVSPVVNYRGLPTLSIIKSF